MQPWHCTADKGYVGLGCDTPFKRRPGKPLLGWQKRFNKGIDQIRYVVERSIAHLKVWRILSTPCRLPQPTTIRAINVIRKIMFYQPPAEPCFPSSWISFNDIDQFYKITISKQRHQIKLTPFTIFQGSHHLVAQTVSRIVEKPNASLIVSEV